MAKPKKEPKKKPEEEEEFWDDEALEEEQDPEEEELDAKKIKLSKLKELKVGMEEVNIEAKIDFIGDVQGKEYGEEPFAIGFLKDGTGEIKVTFWGDDIKKAKPGKKVRIIKCSIGEFKGQMQVYPHKKKGIEFI